MAIIKDSSNKCACKHHYFEQAEYDADDLYGMCKLTGESCPYCSERSSNIPCADKTTDCSLDKFASSNPEKEVSAPILQAIYLVMGSSCMDCDALTKHFYLSDCLGCKALDAQLQLRYLAKCRKDQLAKEKDAMTS